jgi:ABC-type Co2+ transport system permease subunit
MLAEEFAIVVTFPIECLLGSLSDFVTDMSAVLVVRIAVGDVLCLIDVDVDAIFLNGLFSKTAPRDGAEYISNGCYVPVFGQYFCLFLIAAFWRIVMFADEADTMTIVVDAYSVARPAFTTRAMFNKFTCQL